MCIPSFNASPGNTPPPLGERRKKAKIEEEEMESNERRKRQEGKDDNIEGRNRRKRRGKSTWEGPTPYITALSLPLIRFVCHVSPALHPSSPSLARHGTARHTHTVSAKAKQHNTTISRARP